MSGANRPRSRLRIRSSVLIWLPPTVSPTKGKQTRTGDRSTFPLLDSPGWVSAFHMPYRRNWAHGATTDARGGARSSPVHRPRCRQCNGRDDAVTPFLLARKRPVTLNTTQAIRAPGPGETHDLKQPIGNRRCDPWVSPHRLRRHVSPEKLRRELEGQIEKSGEVQLQPLVGRGHARQSTSDRRGKVRQIRAVNKTLTDGAIR